MRPESEGSMPQPTPRISNSSGLTVDEIKRLPVVGRMRNDWRRRWVTVYKLNEQQVVTIGNAFKGDDTVITLEPAAAFKQAIAVFPVTYIYR